MEEEAAQVDLRRLASNLESSSVASATTTITALRGKHSSTAATTETCAKRLAGRQWRLSARSAPCQDGPADSIKQAGRRKRETDKKVFDREHEERIANCKETFESEHLINRMSLKTEQSSEQVRWNPSLSNPATNHDMYEAYQVRKSRPASNDDHEDDYRLQQNHSLMSTSTGHKSLDDGVYNCKFNVTIEQSREINNFKQRPNKINKHQLSTSSPQSHLSYTSFSQFCYHDRNIKLLDNCLREKEEEEEATSSSCKIIYSHHLHSQTKQHATSNKILSIGLLVITILVFSRLTTICNQASAYQLTNNLIANNLPPKFITGTSGAGTGASGGVGSNSEIVVRVKEGSASIGKLIYTLKGEDPDEDPLTFGVLGSLASDLLRIENVPGNQANVYLRKELDRETTESYQVVITLTDGKLGRGNWVSSHNYYHNR